MVFAVDWQANGSRTHHVSEIASDQSFQLRPAKLGQITAAHLVREDQLSITSANSAS